MFEIVLCLCSLIFHKLYPVILNPKYDYKPTFSYPEKRPLKFLYFKGLACSTVIPSKWMHSLVLNDDFCAVEDCEETELSLGSVEEDCEESEPMLGLQVALHEIDLRLGVVEEDCEATELRLGETEKDWVEIEPKVGAAMEDCEASESRLGDTEEDCVEIEPRQGLQEAVDDFEESELRLGLVVTSEQSLEEGLDTGVDDLIAFSVELCMVPKVKSKALILQV